MSSRLVYRMCAQVVPSGEYFRKHSPDGATVKAHLIRCWENLGAVCFRQPIPSGLNLAVAAVLRDSL